MVQLIFAKGTRGEYYLAYNIKNVKMPSYHSIYENACKLHNISRCWPKNQITVYYLIFKTTLNLVCLYFSNAHIRDTRLNGLKR